MEINVTFDPTINKYVARTEIKSQIEEFVGKCHEEAWRLARMEQLRADTNILEKRYRRVVDNEII